MWILKPSTANMGGMVAIHLKERNLNWKPMATESALLFETKL